MNFKKLAAAQLPYKSVESRRQFLAYELEPNKLFFVFTSGVVVCANLTEEEEKAVRKAIGPYLIEPFGKIVSDSYVLDEGTEEKMGLDDARLKTITYHDIELTARVLAQSIEIDYFNDAVDEVIKELSKTQREVQKKVRFLWDYKEFIKIVSFANSIIGSIINELSLLDKPGIAWEKPKHHGFYLRLAEVFEMEDRFQSLQYKVSFVKESSGFIINLLNAKRSEKLELIIIILIVVEIGLWLGEILNIL